MVSLGAVGACLLAQPAAGQSGESSGPARFARCAFLVRGDAVLDPAGASVELEGPSSLELRGRCVELDSTAARGAAAFADPAVLGTSAGLDATRAELGLDLLGDVEVRRLEAGWGVRIRLSTSGDDPTVFFTTTVEDAPAAIAARVASLAAQVSIVVAPPAPASPTPSPPPVAVPTPAPPPPRAAPAAAVAEPARPPSPPPTAMDARFAVFAEAAIGSFGHGIGLALDVPFFGWDIGAPTSLGATVSLGLALDHENAQVGSVLTVAPWVDVLAVWRIRLDPVELGPRAGLSGWIPTRMALGPNLSSTALHLRGVAGAFVALRVAERTELLLTLDAHFGAGEAGVLGAGVRL